MCCRLSARRCDPAWAAEQSRAHSADLEREEREWTSGWSSCRRLLPTVTGAASIEVEQVNLAAYGLKFPGINPIIGPFQVVDFRAYLTQNLVNLSGARRTTWPRSITLPRRS